MYNPDWVREVIARVVRQRARVSDGRSLIA